MRYQPLDRHAVRSVIEGRGAAGRVPGSIHIWVHPDEFGDRAPAVKQILADYPEDVRFMGLRTPDIYRAPADDPQYRWVNYDAPAATATAALDAQTPIADWSQLDGVLANFPNAGYPGLTANNPPDDGRYRIAHWWYWLFERHWSLRGMTNALMDYYVYPNEVHRLFEALTQFYLGIIERSAKEMRADAIFTSDDIGMQTGPFFSPAVFREFFKPYYRRMIQRTHELGMHFWLHTCGCIEPFMEDLIEIGLDVIDPIQKYTMDERRIAERYGGRLCFWAGFDVQQIIPWGTPEEVRQEVRTMIDTYQRPEGRLILGAGNGINGDCPVASLEALYEELFRYGTAKCRGR